MGRDGPPLLGQGQGQGEFGQAKAAPGAPCMEGIDSTILFKIGKHLYPDERIEGGSKLLHSFIKSSSFRRVFKNRCSERLSRSLEAQIEEGLANPYYKRYSHRVEIEKISGVIEQSLGKMLERRGTARDVSPVIEAKIRKLEFLFKKMQIYKKTTE